MVTVYVSRWLGEEDPVLAVFELARMSLAKRLAEEMGLAVEQEYPGDYVDLLVKGDVRDLAAFLTGLAMRHRLFGFVVDVESEEERETLCTEVKYPQLHEQICVV